jgi:hypothetical protein
MRQLTRLALIAAAWLFGAWTVCEQNRLLAVCFGLSQVNKA